MAILKLSHGMERATCPTCKGRGKVPCPPTLGNPLGPNRDKLQVSTGFSIPCPTCKGKKFVPVDLPRHGGGV